MSGNVKWPRARIREWMIEFMEEHGRSPRHSELGTSRSGGPCYAHISKTFGGLKNARLSAGITRTGEWRTKWTAEELIYLAREAFEENGRLPKAKQWNIGRKGQPRAVDAKSLFGSWEGMWKAAGINPAQRVRRNEWDDESILEALRAEAIETGFQPKYEDWRYAKPGIHPGADRVRERFGSWEHVIRLARLDHLPTKARIDKWPRDHLLDLLKAEAKRLGRPPRLSDWKTPTDLHPSYRVVCREFGSWKIALDCAGVSERSRHWQTGNEEAFHAIRVLAAQLGDLPTMASYDSSQIGSSSWQIASRFDRSWRAVLAAAGLQVPERETRWTRHTIRDSILETEAELGRPPSKKWWEANTHNGLPNLSTIKFHFGNWTEAMRFTYGPSWNPPHAA